MLNSIKNQNKRGEGLELKKLTLAYKKKKSHINNVSFFSDFSSNVVLNVFFSSSSF
jgi:hypothetical protein